MNHERTMTMSSSTTELTAAVTVTTNTNNQRPLRLRRHHRLSLVCVNDVYSFDDADASGASSPRGGWSRATTLMKRLARRGGETAYLADEIDASRSCASTSNNLDQGGEPSSSSVSTSSTSTSSILTVANGDVLGGSSLLQHCQGSVAIQVMNSIPIDLAVLGNHEFDYGDDVLKERIKESNFTWLGSNVYYPAEKENTKECNLDHTTNLNNTNNIPKSISTNNYFPGVQGNGTLHHLTPNLTLGFFGLVTKLTPKISYPSPHVIFDPDILSVARRTAQHLRNQGANIIVAITHMSEAEDVLLAKDGIAGVDLILGGHEHEPLGIMVHRCGDDENDERGGGKVEGDIDKKEEKHNEGGVLVFKCGMNAYWVGNVHLDIEYECDSDDQSNGTATNSINNTKTTKVTSIATSWEMHAVTPRVPEDEGVSAIVKKCRKETDAKIMTSCFGQEIASTLSLDDAVATIEWSEDNLSKNNNGNVKALPLDTRMSSVRRKEATGGNMVADAMHWLLQTKIHDAILSHRQQSAKQTPQPPPITLAMINGGFIRGDRLYKPGSEFTIRHIVKEVPFPLPMAVLEMEGRHLKNAMMQQFKGCSRGPTGSFPHLSSNARIKYEIIRTSTSSDENDTTNTDMVELHSFTVNGVEVGDDEIYVIGVTGFVAKGSEGCPSWLEGSRVEHEAWSDVKISRVLLQYLQHFGRIVPVLDGRVEEWKA